MGWQVAFLHTGLLEQVAHSLHSLMHVTAYLMYFKSGLRSARSRNSRYRWSHAMTHVRSGSPKHRQKTNKTPVWGINGVFHGAMLKGLEMREVINEEVSVVMSYSSRKKQAMPYLLNWQNKDYYVGKIGYYHSYMEGQHRQHIFELVDKEELLWFRLRLDSSNLHWTLEAVHDGLAT